MKRLLLGLIIFSIAGSVLAFNAGAADVGDKASDFTAESTKGQITLSGFSGKNVILAFYYAAFTPV